MGTEENGQSSADRKVCSTYIKFVFENLEEVQAKLHRLVELEKEARTLMQELSSEKLIMGAEVEWTGTSKEEHRCPLKQVNEQASGYSIDKIAEELSQKIQESVLK